MPVLSSSVPASLPPSGTAGGDLGGTYPDPTVDLNTAGGTMNGAVSIIPATNAAGLTITHPADNSTKILNLTGVHTTFTLDCDGGLIYSSDDVPTLSVRGVGTRASIDVRGQVAGNCDLYMASNGGFSMYDHNAGTLIAQLALTMFSFHYTSAPADGDLVAGDCAIWFDQDNTTPALKVKAKKANGTVVTGTVLLS